MKLFSILLSAFIFLSFQNYSQNAIAASPDILIIGASVSADHSAPSPGKFLAQQMNINSSNVLVKAKGGAKSTYHKSFIKDKISKLGPHITVAIDLFYHDYKIPKPFTSKDERWIREVVSQLCNSSKMVVLGTALGLNGLGGADDANVLLNTLALEYNNLYLIDVNQIFIDLHSSSGYQYDVNGVQKTLYRTEVLADFIHPNRTGSKVLTNLIIQKIKAKNPTLPDEELTYIDIF